MKNYKVYFNDGVNEAAALGEFANIAEARSFVSDYLKGETLVNVEHSCTDDVFASSAVANLEVYHGNIVELNEDGEPEPQTPIYTSDYFYTR